MLKERFILNEEITIDSLCFSYFIYVILNHNITNYSELVRLINSKDNETGSKLLLSFESLYPILKPWFDIVKKGAFEWQ